MRRHGKGFGEVFGGVGKFHVSSVAAARYFLIFTLDGRVTGPPDRKSDPIRQAFGNAPRLQPVPVDPEHPLKQIPVP